MSQASDQLSDQTLDNHPLVVVLRLIAQSAPQPWYPYRVEGLKRDVLDDVLEDLWLQELIQKAPSSPEWGPAVHLTPFGERVVAERELLLRLSQGQAIDTNSPAAVIRANLEHPPKVWVCKVILALNIAVFLWGLYLASRAGITQNFLIGFTIGRQGQAILHKTGVIEGRDLVNREWWRLISSGFNHLGALHLAMNMYALYAVGWFIEQRWGWWRFLVIYFAAVWTSSCLAMAYQPNALTAGASGGLFGVFAAVIGWLLLYGKYLPAAGRRRAWQNVLTNVLLLAVMSFMLRNYVSHWGHGGGAIGGFVACFVLHAQRFGPALVRLAAVPVILLLPVGGWVALQKNMASSPHWARFRNPNGEPDKEQQIDQDQQPARTRKKAKKKAAQEGWLAGPFYRHHAEPVYESCRALDKACSNMPVADKDVKKDRAGVKRALGVIEREKKALTEQKSELEEVRPDSKEVKEARKKTLELIEAALLLCERGKALLTEPTDASRASVQSQFDKFEELMEDFPKVLKALRR